MSNQIFDIKEDFDFTQFYDILTCVTCVDLCCVLCECM